MEEIVKYLGNFHPVVLHLPIGAFLFTLLLFSYQKFTKISLTIPIRLGLIFSFISAVVSSILGFILQYYGDYDDSLVNFHDSKRAVVMMNNQWWSHDDTDEAKCLREIHFRLEKDDNHYKLCSTGFFRAQAVDIMPKNFYFVYTIMSEVLKKVKKEVQFEVKMGSYTHFVTILVPTRFD